jgi:hypothetical protein
VAGELAADGDGDILVADGDTRLEPQPADRPTEHVGAPLPDVEEHEAQIGTPDGEHEPGEAATAAEVEHDGAGPEELGDRGGVGDRRVEIDRPEEPQPAVLGEDGAERGLAGGRGSPVRGRRRQLAGRTTTRR